MNYRKLQNTRLTNQLLEERYFNTKCLNEDVKFTLGVDNKIVKTENGVPTDLSQEENNFISTQKPSDDSDYKACNPNYFSNYKFNFHKLLRLLDQRFYKCKLGDFIKHSIELSNEERTTRMFCINCNSRYDEVYLKTPSVEQNIEHSIVI